ncbi:MAG: hypothetical protein II897_04155 [Clostridia bacterium]|nr:hypothetical protein [Clostridia bacterium]
MSLDQLHLNGYNPKEKAEAIVNELMRMYDIHIDDATALMDAIGEVEKSTASEERNRTYAEDLFSKFPDAQRSVLDPDIPIVCRQKIYGDCNCTKCSWCWRETMEEEEWTK